MTTQHSYTIGRSKNADISLPYSDQNHSVSRQHIKVEPLDDGNFIITDLGSSNGTQALLGGTWSNVSRATVQLHTRLRLGSYEFSLAELDFFPRPPAVKPADNSGGNKAGRYRRNTSTGEITCS